MEIGCDPHPCGLRIRIRDVLQDLTESEDGEGRRSTAELSTLGLGEAWLGRRGLPASQRDPTRKDKASDAHPKPLWPFLLLLTTCGEGLTQPAFHPLFFPGKIPTFCEQLKSCLGKKANEIFLYFLTSHLLCLSNMRSQKQKKILYWNIYTHYCQYNFFKTIFVEPR